MGGKKAKRGAFRMTAPKSVLLPVQSNHAFAWLQGILPDRQLLLKDVDMRRPFCLWLAHVHGITGVHSMLRAASDYVNVPKFRGFIWRAIHPMTMKWSRENFGHPYGENRFFHTGINTRFLRLCHGKTKKSASENIGEVRAPTKAGEGMVCISESNPPCEATEDRSWRFRLCWDQGRADFS